MDLDGYPQKTLLADSRFWPPRFYELFFISLNNPGEWQVLGNDALDQILSFPNCRPEFLGVWRVCVPKETRVK